MKKQKNMNAGLKSMKNKGIFQFQFTEIIMKLIPGAVTPLGILNDAEHRVQVFMDVEFVGNKIGVHPNDNTATVWMQADDLMKIIQKHGNTVEYACI